MTTDLQRALDAYADALTSFHALAAELADADWAPPTDCPGWRVREQVAHVLAIELQLSGQPLPPRLSTYPAHVRSPSGEHMETGIAALADVPPAELVARLGRTVDEHLGQLRALELDRRHDGRRHPRHPGAVAAVPADPGARRVDPRARTYAGRPGGPAGCPGRRPWWPSGQIAALLPYVVGSGVGPPPGTSVAFDVDG